MTERKTSGMHLQFITESTIGPKERRLIRSHVMKGKNAGKPRPSRRRYDSNAIHQDTRQSKPWTDIPSRTDDIWPIEYQHFVGLNRLLWNDLSLTSFPKQMSPDSRKLIYSWLWTVTRVLYPPEFCSEVDLSQYVWFQYVLEDEAYFHCLLAVSTSFQGRFGGKVTVTPESLYHISQAYKLINERLSGSGACSDKAIAVVTGLAIYQRMHHQQSNGLIHFGGLRRMIQLRGGLAELAKENRTLAQKPWRLSLEFALQDGSPTGFELYEAPGCVALDRSRNAQLLQSTPNSLDLYRGVGAELLDLLLDTSNFSKLLNNSTHEDTKLVHMDYAESVYIRLHRLLKFAPLGQKRPTDPLDNLVHLSLVAVMTTLMPEYGHFQARYDLLSSQLRSALNDYAALAKRNPRLFLWALFVGYATVLAENEQGWLTKLGGETCARLKVHTWADIRNMLCQYAWICVFYDEPGMKLWSKMGRGRI